MVKKPNDNGKQRRQTDGAMTKGERRRELRKVAQTRIEAIKQATLTAIAAEEAELLIKILARGLTSAEAKAFLESIPKVEQLMPPIAILELERALPKPLPDDD